MDLDLLKMILSPLCEQFSYFSTKTLDGLCGYCYEVSKTEVLIINEI
jgi:hypothetical protein